MLMGGSAKQWEQGWLLICHAPSKMRNFKRALNQPQVLLGAGTLVTTAHETGHRRGPPPLLITIPFSFSAVFGSKKELSEGTEIIHTSRPPSPFSFIRASNPVTACWVQRWMLALLSDCSEVLVYIKHSARLLPALKFPGHSIIKQICLSFPLFIQKRQTFLVFVLFFTTLLHQEESRLTVSKLCRGQV